MTPKIYCFRTRMPVEVTSDSQLQCQLDDRRQRGMSVQCLAELEAWHHARLEATKDQNNDG